jgi:L-rhamnose mutarotase
MRYCLALDLKNDPKLIAEYEYWHRQVSPDIKKSIWDAGITDMQLFRFSDRLFMIMETDDSFSFERKTAMDKANPKVQEWEAFVSKFQQPIPGSKEEEKWQIMDQIFGLND